MKFREQLFLVMLSVALTLILKPLIDQKIDEKKSPTISREIVSVNFQNLPKELQKQVTIIPITYRLSHASGGTAKNITIKLSSDHPLDAADLKFDSASEDYTITQVNNQFIKIQVPAIRPRGILAFDLLYRAETKVDISQLAEEGQFSSTDELRENQSKHAWLQTAIVSISIILWVTMVVFLFLGCRRVGSRWNELEIADVGEMDKFREPLLKLIVWVFIYHLILSSLSIVGGFLPVPRMSFEELFYAFLFYFLVTRFKLIENTMKRNAAGRAKDGK